MNTQEGTILGHLEGIRDYMEPMVDWLRNYTTKTSKVKYLKLTHFCSITQFNYDRFCIRPSWRFFDYPDCIVNEFIYYGVNVNDKCDCCQLHFPVCGGCK